jgi:hypothetical protein
MTNPTLAIKYSLGQVPCGFFKEARPLRVFKEARPLRVFNLPDFGPFGTECGAIILLVDYCNKILQGFVTNILFIFFLNQYRHRPKRKSLRYRENFLRKVKFSRTKVGACPKCLYGVCKSFEFYGK